MTSTIPTLNLCQKAFLLTWESTKVANMQGDASSLATALQGHLKDFLRKPDVQTAMEGQWSVVWGPAVFQDAQSDSQYADNVMYVAASPDQSVYVVAIAGTNFSSSYDKNREDNEVFTTKLWSDAFPSLKPYGVPLSINPSPALSTGTALGVNNLLSMTDTLTTQKSLVDFLKSLSATGSKTLIFGGHSLGGALAPTLALALCNPSGGPLSTSRWGHVYVLPVAGPTTVNAGLSEFFKQVFPPVSLNVPKEPYYAWNQNIWNSLDIVPYAWVVDMLNQIPTLYDWKDGEVPLDVMEMVTFAVLASKVGGKSSGPYTQLPNIKVPGTFHGSDPLSDDASFWEQVGYQHLTAYQILFKVQDLISEDAKAASSIMLRRWLDSIPRMSTPSVRRAAAAR